MPMVLSLIPEGPRIHDGESSAQIALSQSPTDGTFRVSARSNRGRTLGRWVSNCPLSVVQTAMLYLNLRISTPQGEVNWQLTEAAHSIPLDNVLQQVPHPVSDQGMPPIEIISLLSQSFQQRPSAPSGVPTGSAPMPPTDSSRQRRLPPPQAASAMPPTPTPHTPEGGGANLGYVGTRRLKKSAPLGDDERALAHVLRDAMRDLRQGASAEDVIDGISDLFDEDDEDLDDEDLDDEDLDDAGDDNDTLPPVADTDAARGPQDSQSGVDP